MIQISPYIQNKKYVIVLDEFQWMANDRDELVTESKMVWDQFLSIHKNTTLILCGSIASFMIEKVIQSKALYGRVTLEIKVSPFQLQEARQLLPQHGQTEVLEAMLLLGGIPLYLEMLNSFHLYILESMSWHFALIHILAPNLIGFLFLILGKKRIIRKLLRR